jgi:peptidyl-prolyl cis-trans isomerase SurA
MRAYSLLLLSLLMTALPAGAAVAPLDRVAVVVDESVIMQGEVDKRIADIKARFTQGNQQLPPDDILHKQVVDQMIMEALQMNMADRAGIKIDDKSLNAAVGEVAGQNHQTLAQFQEQLDKAASGAYADVREQIKRQLMVNRLRQRVMQDRIHISEQDVQNFLKSPQGQVALATEYRLGHILVNLPDSASPEQIATARKQADAALVELQAGKDFAQVAAKYSNAETALKGGDLGWRKQAELPSLFSDSVEKMKVGDVAGPLRTPGGFHLIKLLEKRGDAMNVTQYHVRHILVRPTEILSSDDAHQELADLRSRILKGASFAEMARLHSDDPGSARNGGDLGWVSKGEMVPEFDQVMVSTAAGQLSDVFQSSYGWHILEVEAVRNQDMSQQYREAQARQALYERQYDEELNTWLREMRGSAYIDIKDSAATAP